MKLASLFFIIFSFFHRASNGNEGYAHLRAYPLILALVIRILTSQYMRNGIVDNDSVDRMHLLHLFEAFVAWCNSKQE